MRGDHGVEDAGRRGQSLGRNGREAVSAADAPGESAGSTVVEPGQRAGARKPGARLDRLCRGLVFGRLRGLSRAQLKLVEPGQVLRFGDAAADLQATVHIRDPRVYRKVVLGGALGAADAFRYGWWTSDDLVATIRLFARNESTLERLERGIAGWTRPLRKLLCGRTENSRPGSRRTIAAHYDLSNEFFALFRDRTMTYSSGVFERPEVTLDDASVAKYDRMMECAVCPWL